MQKNSASQSGIFTPRVFVPFALCSLGLLLGMFSLAATPPVETPRANTSVPPANFLSISGSYANRLPPGVPLPPGAQFSPNGQGDPSSSIPTAGFPGFAGMPFRPETARGGNPQRNPLFANQQPAQPSVPRPAASENTPLASEAANDWSVVGSPNHPPVVTPSTLTGVACVSASDCWAVGYYNNGREFQTLIEHWDGSSWSIVDSPNSNPTRLNVLLGVTCESASNCWAVGFYQSTSPWQTLILHWDGTTWSIVPSPNANTTRPNILWGATCESASNCWTVGYYFAGDTGRTLIEHWDGTSWTIVSSPNPSTNNYLLGVTCPSASDCWAVGYTFDGVIGQTLIERWDGTSWVVTNSPNTLPAEDNYLYGLTCVSASNCWAVGFHNNGITDQTLIEHWDGTSWSIVSSPNNLPTEAHYLYGVTCESASNCWAIGFYFNRISSADQTLIEHWDGTSWSIVSSANTLLTELNYLYAVACEAASSCWAVGYANTGGVDQAVIERWDGTSWSIAASPTITATEHHYLAAVTCVSASDCWAVGYHKSNGAAQTLVEHWDGTSWSIVTSPNALNTQESALSGVTCLSTSDCWAVGYSWDGATNKTLIERWDGSSWSIVISPNTSATQSNVLTGMTCVSASDCWAVGYYYNDVGATNQTLIEHWDGFAWSIVTSPNNGTTQPNHLKRVACASASNCWAVGNYFSGVAYQTLIEHWDGTSWSIATSPNGNTSYSNFLEGVTCPSGAADCWAVGYYSNGSVSQTLIQRWDGTSWVIVSSPNTLPTEHNFLSGMTCVSASDCWAVGFNLNTSNVVETLIEQWDGSSWAIVNSPNTSATQYNLLFSVACPSASQCRAVGYYSNAYGVNQTLIEHYKASPVPTSVVSRKTHGSSGDFDIDLPITGNPGIECRRGGTAGNYRMIVTFPSAVTCNNAQVTGGTGSVSNFSVNASGTKVTVNLTGVGNGQTITVTLLGVNDGNNTGDVAVRMGVLLGDTTANRAVNSSDIAQTKSKSGQAVTSTNFRQDVTINGSVNSSDIALVKSKSGTALP